jgi:AraC family transcriptional regulator
MGMDYMDIQIIERSEITIGGIVTETSVETCSNDLKELWDHFEERKLPGILRNAPGYQKGRYGVMWYTENHRYCYLLGMETKATEKELNGATIKTIPPARYAMVSVPEGMTVFQAWGVFFEKDLPGAGLEPVLENGLYFEFYPDEDEKSCQLWTPIK